ncbi:MAG: Rne/Rng family ribonuclease, partial [Candidatus Sumerlaeota bacterium]
RVEGIVPGLQAAFVNIGLDRNAFLHFSDIADCYSLPDSGAAQQSNGKSGSPQKHSSSKGGKTPLQLGQEILVQALKEPISTKGARVTMNASIPGRFLVYLPTSNEKSGGVSRRIESASERRRLRSILKSLDSETGSFIIRTAGLSQDQDAIESDVEKLKQRWERICEKGEKQGAPSLVYDDHGILGRMVRDELTDDIDEIMIDSEEHADVLEEVLEDMIPHLADRLEVVDEPGKNLFEKFDVENQFQKALGRKVWLKSGGSIIIEETEALVSIDVNSGKFVGNKDQESMILKTNLEAAEAIGRQLRLRDLGGIIVVDFIDMRPSKNQRELERTFNAILKRDRAKTTTNRLSDLGLMEMTRKRVRQSLSKVVFMQCPYCEGSGRVLTGQQLWKRMKYDIAEFSRRHTDATTLKITVHPLLREFLEKEVLKAVKDLSTILQVKFQIEEDNGFHLERFEIDKG